MDQMSKYKYPFEFTLSYITNVPIHTNQGLQIMPQAKAAQAVIPWNNIKGIQEFVDYHLFPDSVPRCRIIVNAEEQTTYIANISYDEMKTEWFLYLEWKAKQKESKRVIFNKSKLN